MVVFTQEDLKSFVEEKRRAVGFATTVIIKNLADLPYAAYFQTVQQILSSDVYLQKIANSSRLECRLPWYSLLVMSKFDLVCEAAEKAQNHDQVFAWIDAGAGRWIREIWCASAEWPEREKVCSLVQHSRFAIQASPYSNIAEFLLRTTSADEEEYWCDRPPLQAGFMVALKSRWLEIASQIRDVFVNEMLLQRKVVNTEQTALGILFRRNPLSFNVLPHNASLNEWCTILADVSKQ